MIAFEVCLNGKRVTLAGHPDLSVLSACVTGGSLNCPNAPDPDNPYAPHLSLRVGGLTGRPEGQADEHLKWGGFINLVIGDEVMVRLIQTESPDQYTESSVAEGKIPAPISEEEIFAICKTRYFELREKYESRGA